MLMMEGQSLRCSNFTQPIGKRLFSVNGFFHTVKSDEWLSFYTGVCAAFLIYYLEYGKSYALILVLCLINS